MRYQISFQRLGRVHWLFCDDKQAALLTWDALKVAGNTHIECLENPDKANARWVQLDELEGIAAS